MSLRKEFVMLARQPDANISELCRRFEISRKTAYKYLSRYAAKGTAGLADQSRRPQQSPRRTSMPI
jgi:transposase-like protein